jgi:hypothetical protein
MVQISMPVSLSYLSQVETWDPLSRNGKVTKLDSGLLLIE